MKCKFDDVIHYLSTYWKSFVIVLVPLVFLPLIYVAGKVSKCGYVICIMAFYWMTEALPIPITSIIPIVLFPLFGILSTEEVSAVYFKETIVMFLGSMILAAAIEDCNLHKRIALRIILLIGTGPKSLLLSFMVSTMFLSMWMCNAAATALMVPIVSAVLNEVKMNTENEKSVPNLTESVTLVTGVRDCSSSKCETRRESSTKNDIRENNEPDENEIPHLLGVAYAANIGGTGTLTGTATNLTFKGIFESIFPEAETINFATWMLFNVPLMAINIFLAWLWLQIFHMDLFRKKSNLKTTKKDETHLRNVFLQDYNALGHLSYRESSILCLFLIDVLLWFFRKPEFITGWSAFFPDKVVKDATPAMAIVLLLFILPANLDFLKLDKKNKRESPGLLSWKIFIKKIPFGLILLLGGGFAISKASEVSGLSKYFSSQLKAVSSLSHPVILIIVVVVTTMATEIVSNAAVASIFLPVLGKMCQQIGLHPLYLMLPATLCCSYAFMLPIASPPNAIIATSSNVRTFDMIKSGLGMNLICSASLIICFIFIGVPIYGLASFPKWAESKNMTFFS